VRVMNYLVVCGKWLVSVMIVLVIEFYFSILMSSIVVVGRCSSWFVISGLY